MMEVLRRWAWDVGRVEVEREGGEVGDGGEEGEVAGGVGGRRLGGNGGRVVKGRK
jgi:hypothetical protein